MAAFVVVPVMLHFSTTVAGAPPAANGTGLWICFGLLTGGDADWSLPVPARPGPALRGVLIGSVEQETETLLGYRDKYGPTHFSVLEPHMTELAQVIGKRGVKHDSVRDHQSL